MNPGQRVTVRNRRGNEYSGGSGTVTGTVNKFGGHWVMVELDHHGIEIGFRHDELEVLP